MSVPFVVVSDFDGTITERDLVVALTTRFNPANQTVVDQINARQLHLKEGLEILFQTLPSADRSTYESFLRNEAIFRTGFHRFERLLEDARIPFYIVSNGLDFMLNAVLGENSPHAVRMANQARFDGEVIQIGWQYPCTPPCPGGCGLCKHAVVEELRRRYQAPVVFIGDGVTDFNGALHADTVFARSRLADFLEQAGKPYIPFDSFDDIMTQLFVPVEGGAS
ncbi:MtnX-like HAD-IB family phosphatase [Sulfobacillus harzensis]|nr:MtnX-like HAD-IB family phosphatase [Sulfobacillus harzensis]